MRASLILQDENGEDLDLLKVSQVVVVDNVQYACIHDFNGKGTAIGRVIKEYDNTTRLEDIEDDQEFLKVQEIFMNLGAGN